MRSHDEKSGSMDERKWTGKISKGSSEDHLVSGLLTFLTFRGQVSRVAIFESFWNLTLLGHHHKRGISKRGPVNVNHPLATTKVDLETSLLKST